MAANIITTNFEEICEAHEEIQDARRAIAGLDHRAVLLAICEETGREHGAMSGDNPHNLEMPIDTASALASGYDLTQIVEDFFRGELYLSPLYCNRCGVAHTRDSEQCNQCGGYLIEEPLEEEDNG